MTCANDVLYFTQVLDSRIAQYNSSDKMSSFIRLAALLALARVMLAAPAASDCTGTIASLDDVDDAVKCTTVVINSFTVPAGETFNLDLADGTTVNMGALGSSPPCRCSRAATT